MIELTPNWRTVLAKAWSIRMMILAGVLSGIEIVLPLFASNFPRGVFAVLTFISVFCALIARILAQKEIYR